MAKFSVGGDEDENEKEIRRLTKKPRTSFDPIAHRHKRVPASTSNSGASASTSKARNSASTSAPPLVRESRLDKQGHSGSPPVFSDDDDSDDGNEPSDAKETDLEEEPLFKEEAQLYRRRGDWIQVGGLPVNLTPDGNSTGTKSAEPLSLTLTDSDVLDCSVCFEPLKSPVYQCENGHIACSSCCTNMKNKCACCSMPIGYNRCRAIEKVIESIRVSCPNMQYGCTASLHYNKKLDHERKCYYTPCSCPYPDCTYAGLPSSLYSHFASKHANSSNLFFYGKTFSILLDSGQNHAFLQSMFQNTLFVLSRYIEPRGSFVNVVWIAPALSETRFSYAVSAMDGVSSVELKTVVKVTPQLTEQPSDKTCLFVPNDFVTSGGHLKLKLAIRRDTE